MNNEISKNMSLERKEGSRQLTRREFIKYALMAGGSLALGEISLPRIISAVKERSEELKLSVDFLFLTHTAPEDLKELREIIKNVDVFIPEEFGWNQKRFQEYNDISQGKTSQKELDDIASLEPYEGEKLRIIHGTKIPVFFIDAPEGHELLKEWGELEKRRGIDFTLSFEANLKELKQLLKEEAAFHRRREDLMINNLFEVIKESQERLTLTGEKIKILLEIGASHTRLYHLMKLKHADQKTRVTRMFGEMPYIFSYLDEARRRYWFREDEERPLKAIKGPTDEEMARTLLGQIMGSSFFWDIERVEKEDTTRVNRLFRKIAAQYTYDETKELFEKIQQLHASHPELGPKDYPPKEEFQDLLNRNLKSKGITLPSTQQELERAIKPAKPLLRTFQKQQLAS